MRRSLHYTPHYTLALMGHRRRILVDAGAGVYRYDQLIVLRETTMPAVLLEAGSIVNRQEELELGAPERRSLTSAAIVTAVENFCAARTRPPGVRAAASGHSSNLMSAYTVVRAESHDAAAKLFERHPRFTIFPADSVEVMPVLPIPSA